MFKPYFIDGNESQKYFLKQYSNTLTRIKSTSKNNYFNKESQAQKVMQKKLGK